MVKGSWLILGLVTVIVLRTTPEDTGTQGLLIGIMALLYGFYLEYQVGQLRDRIEYQG